MLGGPAAAFKSNISNNLFWLRTIATRPRSFFLNRNSPHSPFTITGNRLFSANFSASSRDRGDTISAVGMRSSRHRSEVRCLLVRHCTTSTGGVEKIYSSARTSAFSARKRAVISEVAISNGRCPISCATFFRNDTEFAAEAEEKSQRKSRLRKRDFAAGSHRCWWTSKTGIPALPRLRMMPMPPCWDDTRTTTGTALFSMCIVSEFAIEFSYLGQFAN